MAEIIYSLCALTSGLCAVLLVRACLRQKTVLLLWSAISFIGLTIASVLLVVDLVVLPEVDLSLARGATSAVSITALVIGLVWSSSKT